jgi:hypothetical protein
MTPLESQNTTEQGGEARGVAASSLAPQVQPSTVNWETDVSDCSRGLQLDASRCRLLEAAIETSLVAGPGGASSVSQVTQGDSSLAPPEELSLDDMPTAGDRQWLSWG